MILVFHNATDILGWIVNEDAPEKHLGSGYAHLKDDHDAGIVFSAVIDIPEEEIYRPDLYEVVNGEIQRKVM